MLKLNNDSRRQPWTSCIRIRIYVASSGKLGCLHGNSSCCLDNTLNNNNNSNNGDNKCDSDSCYLALALWQVVATTTDKRRQLVTKTNANCRARSLLLSDSFPLSFALQGSLMFSLAVVALFVRYKWVLLFLFGTNSTYPIFMGTVKGDFLRELFLSQ